MPPVFLAHESSMRHDTGGHPEQPARMAAIVSALESRDWMGLDRRVSEPAPRAALEAVHPAAHIDAIAARCARGGGAIDFDTVVSSDSYEAALHGAGGAVGLVDLLMNGEAQCGFSAHRPPGHHATRDRAMGFCLFNSIAVAARHALDACGCQRVLILDWDVHHGNGTNDIFHATDAVLFVSIHQSPLYPGTGRAGDVGSGAGTGFSVNLPVASGAGDSEFLSLVEHVAGPLARSFAPQLVLVSAGYDAHRADPLADCRLSEAGFAAMTRSLRRLSAELEAPLGFVLEGGYALDALASSVVATLEALEGPIGDAPEVPRAPVATEALQRLSQWWPALD
jgi:acetoin utilization deacetylase AcuC-like enzyme